MSCSTCNLWMECDHSDNEASDNLIKPCFRGTKFDVNKVTLLIWIRKHTERKLTKKGIYMLDVVRRDANLFTLRCIGKITNNGPRCVCDIMELQLRYSVKLCNYSVNIGQLVVTWSEDKFRKMFGVSALDNRDDYATEQSKKYKEHIDIILNRHGGIKDA